MRAFFAVLLSGMVPQQAFAADTPPPSPDPTEIVVTGERVRQSLKDTPSSVAVRVRKDIDAAAAPDRIEQLLAGIPNVQLGSGGEAPTIRGQDGTGVLRDLPAFLGGARPRATLQIDGRAVSYNEFAYGAASLWDVDRVEVFRSPQTTTQGRNSIGGAIFIQTADPTNAPEARARAIAGDLDTRQLSAMVSGPLIGDQLAVRLTGDLRRSRTSSRLSGNIAGANLNRDDFGNARVKLLARPNALPGLRLLMTYAHVESDMPQIESIAPPFKARRNQNLTSGYFSTNVDSLTAAGTYQITAALESRTTISWGDAAIRRFAPPGFGETRIRGHDASVESVLEWNPSQDFRLVGGLHDQSTRLDQRINLSAALLGEGIFKDRQSSTGLFAEARWAVLPRLSVTGGARYQMDSQNRAGALTGEGSEIPLDYRKRFHALLPKISIAYDANANFRIGAMIQRAYNPGGVTINLFTRGTDRFDAEYLWDYELFARGTMFDGHLTLATNLFYNAMKDAQRQQRATFDSPGGPVFFSAIANAPAAHSYGAETEISYRPTSRLSARIGLGLLRTRITKAQLDSDPLLGKAFNRAPHLTGSAAIDWKPREQLRLSAQVRHHSPYFSDDANTPALKVEGATTVDAKAEWQFRRFRLFGYARNLLDSFNLTYRFNPTVATAEDPRELGLGIEASF
jgi:outer membrane receptor protein involved in Fe transport